MIIFSYKNISIIQLKTTIVVCLLFLAGFSVFSQSPDKDFYSKYSDSDLRDFDSKYYNNINFLTLYEARRFHRVSYGDSGRIYTANIAFYNLLKESNPEKFFDLLLDDPSTTNEGKMYGLAGLYICDREKYNEKKKKIRNVEILIIHGITLHTGTITS